MAIVRKETVAITISISHEIGEIAKRAVNSGRYRNVSHFFSFAAMNQAKADGLIAKE